MNSYREARVKDQQMSAQILAVTKENLKKVEDELSAVRGELSSSNRELKDTQRQLESTQLHLNKGRFSLMNPELLLKTFFQLSR